MDLFGLGIAIFYFLIISKSYEWICKINRKEQIVFSLTHASQFLYLKKLLH